MNDAERDVFNEICGRMTNLINEYVSTTNRVKISVALSLVMGVISSIVDNEQDYENLLYTTINDLHKEIDKFGENRAEVDTDIMFKKLEGVV